MKGQTAAAMRAEALSRATQGISLANYPTIIEGFTSRGIPETDIRPRENVLTFAAWKALGRHVRKGEHGVRVVTFIEATAKAEREGEQPKTFRRPWHTTVFHFSQTDPDA